MEKHSPYVGPRAYRYGERLYGRDRESRDLLNLVLAERIVLLYSPSGAGKSSLLAASLMPFLEKEGFQVLGPARVSGAPAQRSGGGVVNPYAASLIHYWEDARPKEVRPIDDLGGIDLAGYLTQRSWIRNDPGPKVLILDQFEEIITRNPLDRDARNEFFRQLGISLQDRNRWAVIAMREEHIAALDPCLDYVPTRLAARYRLDLLTHETAREAVAGPAESVGVAYHARALDRLIHELTVVREPGVEPYHTPYVEPLHLQLACDRLWQRLPDGTTEVGPKLVDTAGTVAEALEGFYRSAVQTALRQDAVKETGCDEKRIRDWFERELISPAGLRDQLQRGGTFTGSLPNPVAEALEERYLLRSESRRGTIWYEIAHDRLLEAVRSDNRAWYGTQDVSMRLLRDGAERYGAQRGGRASDLAESRFLAGEPLERVETWAAANVKSLSDAEKDYLDACRENRRREQDKARLSKVIRWAVRTILVLLALAAAGLWRFGHNALVARTDARVHRLISDAAQARWRDWDHELSVLLTLQAERFSERIGVSPEVKSRIMNHLRNTLLLRPFTLSPQLPGALKNHVDPCKTAFLANFPDEWLIATASGENKIEILPLRQDRENCPRPVLETRDGIRSLAPGPAGRYLVVATESGVELFLAERLRRAGKSNLSIKADVHFPLPAAPSGPFCMTADDSLLFAATEGGRIECRSVGDAAACPAGFPVEYGGDGFTVTAMACDPKGRWIALGEQAPRGAKGRVSVLPLETGKPESPRIFENRFDDWPEEAKDFLERLRGWLDYGVAALLPMPDGSRLIAVFRHGPIGIVPIPDALDEKPQMIYAWPTLASIAVLKSGFQVGRTSMFHHRIPKFLEAALIGNEGLLAVGSEKFLGEWDLRSFYADPFENEQVNLEGPNPPPRVYAGYREIKPSQASIVALSALERGSVLAELDAELNARLWLRNGLVKDLHSTVPVRLDNGRPEDNVIWTLGFMPGGRMLVAGGSSYLAFPEVNPQTLERPKGSNALCYTGSYRRMSLSPDGRRLAVVAKDYGHMIEGCRTSSTGGVHSVLVMDLDRKTGAGSLEEPWIMDVPDTEGLWSVAWAKGKWTGGRDLIASGDYTGKVRLWLLDGAGGPPEDRTPRFLPGSRGSRVWALALHPTAPYLALGTDDGALEIWRLTVDGSGRIDGELLKNPAWIPQGSVWALAWSPDGSMLAFGNGGGYVGAVLTADLPEGSWRVSQRSFAHIMGVTSIAFCGDSEAEARKPQRPRACRGNVFASAGNDGKIVLWVFSKGAKPPDLLRRDQTLEGAGGEEAKPRVSLRQDQTLEGARGEILSVAFSPDGDLVAAGDTRGQVHVWRVENESIPRKACRAVSRNLTLREWVDHVGEKEDYDCTCPDIPPEPGVTGRSCRQASAGGF